MNSIEPLVIDVSPIHDIESTRFEDQLIQDIDVVDLGGRHHHNAGDVPSQVQQGVQLDSRLGLPEFRPWEQRKTKVDGRGVQSIRSLHQIDTQLFPEMEFLSTFDENSCEIPENPPIPGLVGVGKGAPGDFSRDSGVIPLALHGAQAGNDVPQTLPKSQLSEDHDHELGITTEGPYATISLILMDTPVELVSRQKVQQLGKNGSSLVHAATPHPLSGEGSSAEGTFQIEVEKSSLPRRNQY